MLPFLTVGCSLSSSARLMQPLPPSAGLPEHPPPQKGQASSFEQTPYQHLHPLLSLRCGSPLSLIRRTWRVREAGPGKWESGYAGGRCRDEPKWEAQAEMGSSLGDGGPTFREATERNRPQLALRHRYDLALTGSTTQQLNARAPESAPNPGSLTCWLGDSRVKVLGTVSDAGQILQKW